MRYVFDDCTLDTECYELRRAGVRIPLRPKVFRLLAYLITYRDRVVLKDELIAHLWPKQFVGDAVLKSCIMTARKAVGDAERSQRIIQTLHGHGYRFVADVITDEPAPPAGSTGPVPSRVSAPPAPDNTVATGPVAVTSLTATSSPRRSRISRCCTAPGGRSISRLPKYSRSGFR
jgi:DNA-binding winged helix-turn-helix (wHTH) protein